MSNPRLRDAARLAQETGLIEFLVERSKSSIVEDWIASIEADERERLHLAYQNIQRMEDAFSLELAGVLRDG